MASFKIENRIWDPVAESMPRGPLRELQTTRLRGTVERAAQVAFYKEAFQRLGVGRDSISDLEDVRRLPLTTKDDLRSQYPLGMVAVPRERLVRVHGSSGTTGKPTFVAYTAADIDLWSEMGARVLVAGGLRPEHTLQVSYGYGLYTTGFGLHQGAERIGATVLPVSSGNTLRQVLLLHDLAVDALACTPSYALNIAEVAREQGLDPETLPLRMGYFGGEPWSEDMALRIEQALGIAAFDNYGLSEILGPGVGAECAAQAGMHLQEDHFLVECLNPETLEPVAEGEQGELVITTLTKEAMPLIRYRTRDIASIRWEPCACGRTFARISRIVGRTDDMLRVRGVGVFPSQIEEALLRVDGTAPHYRIEVDRPGALDRITVKVELRPQDFTDRLRELQALRGRIDRQIYAITGIRVNVELVEPRALQRTVGKSRRVIDLRKQPPLV